MLFKAGQFTPKSKIQIFLYRFFWCELLTFGEFVCTDVCLLSNIIKTRWYLVVELKVPKKIHFNSNVSFQKS